MVPIFHFRYVHLYHLHQSKFVCRSLCDSHNIVFVSAVVAVVAIAVIAAAAAAAAALIVVVEVVVVGDGTADCPSIQGNHAACQCLRLAVSFCLFSG